ncbi:548b9f0d-7290-4e60-957b-ee2b088f12f2 [Thermothielavioides terrestris]|uniref:548b9f0d-7290-4e60-957b-ee2b088f12f2 n=1 Tax=Thermothielavioides terrestris TaxID=2587410 RepID=A0A3S4CBF5_9PEZI|nr:548b9f0d-7290-4e60-957b-ee2b088f12f2 [Thermothielavioides terrestris]
MRNTSQFSSFDTAPLARSSPALALQQQEVALVARDIWEEAYNEVKSDETLKPLVKNYEELYITLGTGGLLGSRRSSRVMKEPDNDDDERSGSVGECFTRLAQEHLELARQDAANQGIVSSAVQFIQKTKEAVGLALAASPPASLAWTGICTIVLPIIVNHAEQIAARESGFAYVMSRFTWYGQVLDLLNREYWTSPQSFSALRNAIHDEIVALYKLLIEYHLRAYYTFCRPLATISRDFLKLDDWNHMISEIKESEKRLEEYMSLNYEQHLLDKLHTLSKDALHKQRIETILKFKFPDDLPYSVYQAYLDSIDSPQDGTGAGVLTHPDFINWASGESGVFILEGIPGSGKSVLSKSLLTELPKWRDTYVCAFFFKDNGKGQNAAPTALCRVLDELFREQPDLVDTISPRIDHLLPEEVRCNFDLLWNVLEEATRDCEPGSVTVILDGFDECEPDSATKLCAKLREYFAGPSPRLKFFLTTRPLVSAPELTDVSSVIVLKLEEDPHCRRHISKDIERVVMARFDGFALKCIQDAALRRELLELVRPKEDRTYLYVKLLFDYLELRMRDGMPRVPRGWVDIFRTLPATVKEAYVGFLNRVRENQREDVRRLFQIVLAAARPLTVREVNIALNIRDLPNGSQHGLGLQNEGCFRNWILDACKYFLDVYNGRVYFIHQTAKDFLLSGPGENGHSKPDWLGNFTMQTCHCGLATSCILYLSLPLRTRSRFIGFDAPAESADDYHLWDANELEFATYAQLFWHSHVRGMLGSSEGPEPTTPDFMTELRPWYQKVLTAVLLSPPWSGANQAQGQALRVVTVNGTHLRIADLKGSPLPWLPCVPINATDAAERLAAALRSLATFQTIRSLAEYQYYSPVQPDWFSARLFKKNGPADHTTDKLELFNGDSIRYVVSNRTNCHPAHVHMLSLNASWTVGVLLWHVHVPPRQQRTGELSMALPRRVNADDPTEANDTVLVIFCVGEQCAERLTTASEWFKSIHVPPVWLDPEKAEIEVPVRPFFVPPPNWLVKRFSIRTLPRLRSGSEEGTCGMLEG